MGERLLSQPDGSCAAVLTRQLTNTVIGVLAGHWGMGRGRETTLLGGVKATACSSCGWEDGPVCVFAGSIQEGALLG